MLWFTHGAMTQKIMRDNTHVDEIHDLSEFTLDADVIEEIFNNPDPKNAQIIEKMLVKRFKKFIHLANFKKLSVLFERAYGYIKEYY